MSDKSLSVSSKEGLGSGCEWASPPVMLDCNNSKRVALRKDQIGGSVRVLTVRSTHFKHIQFTLTVKLALSLIVSLRTENKQVVLVMCTFSSAVCTDARKPDHEFARQG